MKEKDLVFRKARESELPGVLSLYKSVLGEPFCVWNEYYPGMSEVEGDFAAGALYVLTQGDALVGAASIVPQNEMDHLACWSAPGREIARIVVAKEHRGGRLALGMVACLKEKLRLEGCRWLHLSAAEGNLPAVRTYERAGFRTVGHEEMYGGEYRLMECDLTK